MIKIIKGGSYLSNNDCRKRGIFRRKDGWHDTGLRIRIKYFKSFNFYEFGETFDVRASCFSNICLHSLSLRLKIKYRNV